MVNPGLLVNLELRLPFQREGESTGPVSWGITTDAYYGKVFCHAGPWPLKRHCWKNCILPCLVSLWSDPGLAYRKGVLSTAFTNTTCSGCSNSLQLSARHKRSMNHLGTVKFQNNSVNIDLKAMAFWKDVAHPSFLFCKYSHDQLQSEVIVLYFLWGIDS